MSTVEDVTAALAQMPPADVSRVRAWLDEQAEAAAQAWDDQIERDILAGRLDHLLDAADAEHKAGRTRPLEDGPHP